jgi:hypothetical protein
VCMALQASGFYPLRLSNIINVSRAFHKAGKYVHTQPVSTFSGIFDGSSSPAFKYWRRGRIWKAYRERTVITPQFMHMGDFHLAFNRLHKSVPSSVYQILSPRLLVRAFFMKRKLSGLGLEAVPSFLHHPAVTAKSIGTHHI